MDIRIEKLTLENFKCHRLLELNLEGKSASIYGANGTGKTSVYDGFLWLLFGRDSGGTGEVKPLNRLGRTADPQAVTAVEAVLTRDGTPLTLRRCLRETRRVRRGSDTPVFEGNVCDYFVDGAPCRKGTFDRVVRELAPEPLFRMLTDVTWFASGMKWQERRAVLFHMVGGQSDKALIQEEPRFAPLLPGLENQTLEGYQARLLREKRGYCHSREQFHARLDECGKFLEAFQETPSPAHAPSGGEGLQWELEALGERLRSAGAQDAQAQVRQRLEGRMAVLREREQAACKELNRIEEQLYLAQAFTRYKAGQLEETVNGLFRLATVRFHRELLNGETEERCDILSGGIPFPDLNSARKVQVGLDLISALSRFYGVRVPLFIDNGERVTHLDGCEGQLIRLAVRPEDRELRVELWESCGK